MYIYHTSSCNWPLHPYIYMYIYTIKPICCYRAPYIYMHIYICNIYMACIYACVHIYIYVYIYTYINIHIYHIHTYIHTYTDRGRGCRHKLIYTCATFCMYIYIYRHTCLKLQTPASASKHINPFELQNLKQRTVTNLALAGLLQSDEVPAPLPTCAAIPRIARPGFTPGILVSEVGWRFNNIQMPSQRSSSA